MYRLNVNGQSYEVGDDVDPKTPLLWVLRDHLGLVGTKYGCGIGQCGACTVHLNGAPTRSCSLPVERSPDQQITTIEGLAGKDGKLHAVQQALDRARRPAVRLLPGRPAHVAPRRCSSRSRTRRTRTSTAAMNGNICRCGTYPRIRKAIHAAANKRTSEGGRHERGRLQPDPYVPPYVQEMLERRSAERARALNRRAFIKLTGVAGGGLALAIRLGDRATALATGETGRDELRRRMRIVQIAPDGTHRAVREESRRSARA